ncbi:uncharacterized protein LOC116011363 [Ipomoea triloba]|uniref:uncharacterized protein LOC116011363 n=1 Tax=Ipomoea triloba TaxID=35885 RepID=UPI00125E4332|nr:uncharacterized protein LOC116011363 [Ipomoea triloba]
MSTKIGHDPWLPTEDNPFITTSLPEAIYEAPVSSLLNMQGLGWDEECVKDIFNERDASIVLNIPVSLRRPSDAWVWYKEAKGEYTVKSAYRMLVGELQDNRPWRLLWNLKTDESARYLFMDCTDAVAMWTTIGLSSPTLGQDDMQCKFVMLCWGLWGSRNNKVWNGNAFDCNAVIHSSLTFLTNWKAAYDPMLTTQGSGGRLLKWKAPSPDRLKMNTDIAMDIHHNIMGLGWVLRDHHGMFLAAKAMQISGNYSVQEAEAVCIREALSWLKGTGMGDVDIETDSQLVYYALSSNPFISTFGFLIDDIKEVASMIEGVDFCFVKRSANRAAHIVAREAVSLTGCGEWFDTPPLYLVDCLLSDLMN